MFQYNNFTSTEQTQEGKKPLVYQTYIFGTKVKNNPIIKREWNYCENPSNPYPVVSGKTMVQKYCQLCYKVSWNQTLHGSSKPLKC